MTQVTKEIGQQALTNNISETLELQKKIETVKEQTKVTVWEHYQARDKNGSGYFSDNRSSAQDWRFDTYEQLIEALEAFKENPRLHNPSMTDESVEYWKRREYTIQKIVTTTIDIHNI